MSVGPDLFSEALVDAYVEHDPRFVERAWLAELVDEALAADGCRYVLLAGEPGSGKTALLAWLARRHRDRPRYFIRRDSRTPLHAGDARSFLLALGHQLAALRPRLFDRDRLEIVVRQRVKEVAAGGKAVALDVDELLASPFSETVVRVEQEGGVVTGELAGISVGRLVADERLLELETLQYLALLDPAAVLATEDPGARIVVLVDGLDELRSARMALRHGLGEGPGGGADLLAWVAACPPLPANVRFVLTSRPDPDLLATFRAAKETELAELELGRQAEIDSDLRRFLAGFVAEPATSAALGAHGVDPGAFVGDALARAQGNFQYAVALTRGIDAAIAREAPAAELEPVLRLDGIPSGTAELYRFFLARIKEWADREPVRVSRGLDEPEDRPAWEALYHPVLGALAVSFDALSVEQLGTYAAAPPAGLPRALEQLAQFLDQLPDGRFRLYHATLPEFLTGAETGGGADPFHVDPAQWHALLAGRLLRANPDWVASRDGYALAHTAAHLAEAIRLERDGEVADELRRSLYALIGRGLLRAKLRRTGSQRAFAEDVALALEAAGAEEPPNLVELVRGSLVDATLRTLSAAVPAQALGILARAGREEKALDHAALIQDGRLRSEAYREIALGLLARRERDGAGQAIEEALAAAGAIVDAEQRAGAMARVASAIAQAADRPRALELAAAAQATAETLPEGGRTRALLEVADALAQAGDAAAAVALVDEAAESARSWLLGEGFIEMRGANGGLLARAASVAATAGDRKRGAGLAGEAYRAVLDVWKPPSARDLDRVRALGGVAAVHARARRRARAAEALASATAIAEAIQDQAEAALARAALALMLARSGETAGAEEAAEAVVATAEGIPDSGFRAGVLAIAASALLEAGAEDRATHLAERAVDLAAGVNPHMSEVVALDALARELAPGSRERLELAGRALTSARTLPDRDSLPGVWYGLGRTLADAALVEEAAIAAGEGEEARAWLLHGVVDALAEEGDGDWLAAAVDAAERAADAVADPARRGTALVTFAAAAGRVAGPERAVAVLERARRAAEDVPSGAALVQALAALANGLTEAGESEAAAAAVGDAWRAADEIRNPRERAGAQATLVAALVQAGREDEALELAQGIRDFGPAVWAYGVVARARARAGDVEGALELVRQDPLGLPESWPEQDDVRVEVVLALARDRRTEQALDQARDLTPQRRMKVLQEAAAALAGAGDLEGALEAAAAIEDPGWRSVAVAEAAGSLARAGETARALAQARELEDPRFRTMAFAGVARELAARGDAAAAEVAGDAVATTQAIEDAVTRAEALSRVAAEIAGAVDEGEARSLARLVVTGARPAGRNAVFDAIRTTAPLLAPVDDGETLRRTAAAVLDVETWWSGEAD